MLDFTFYIVNLGTYSWERLVMLKNLKDSTKFEDGVKKDGTVQKISLKSLNLSNNEIRSLHYGLCHPSFPYLKTLFPPVFANKYPTLFKCVFFN